MIEEIAPVFVVLPDLKDSTSLSSSLRIRTLPSSGVGIVEADSPLESNLGCSSDVEEMAWSGSVKLCIAARADSAVSGPSRPP